MLTVYILYRLIGTGTYAENNVDNCLIQILILPSYKYFYFLTICRKQVPT